jgi:molecular chaperone DnaJ
VTVAYEVLRDPERRARYDRFGPEGVFGAGRPGWGGFGFEGGLGDIFEAFFGQMGGGGRRRGPAARRRRRGADRLEFAEAVFGCRKEISVRLPVTCDACEGRGTARAPSRHLHRLPGAGELRRVRQSLLGQVVTSVACSRCSGLGETIPNPCAEGCRGEGRRMEESTFTVEVPAGVEDGSTLRLADRGAAGPRGARTARCSSTSR